jgi:hypothetical protein
VRDLCSRPASSTPAQDSSCGHKWSHKIPNALLKK